MDPQLDFWRQLGFEMVEITLDEEKEAGGFDRRRLREKKGALGDNELVTAPKYCGTLLVDENRWRRVKQPYHKQICNNRSGHYIIFTKKYCKNNTGIFLCAECYATHVLDADT